MYNDDPTDTEELRHHIHHLLRDYSRTHYTTNYIDFTESLVAEFVEGLKPVPLIDPYTLVIPPDPYDVFAHMHGLSSLAPYDQTFKTTDEARLYLKKVMGPKPGVPKIEGVIWDNDYGKNYPLHEPIFAALSRKARQSAPKLGSKKHTDSFPKVYRDLLKSQGIGPIRVEETEDPPLSIDENLRLKFCIDDQDLPAVRSLLESTSKMLCQQKEYKNKYLDPTFLRDDSSTYEYRHPEIFVPIFPRARMPKSGMSPTAPFSAGLKENFDLPSKILSHVVVDDSDDDISMQNLKIVDEWETVKSSLPSTPSSSNSNDSDDQINQFLLHSTPNTEPLLVEKLFKAQIEVPQFPRSQKIGGNAGIKPHILAGKTLGTFLQSLLVKTTMQSAQQPITDQCSSPEPSSLLGQPPSAVECSDKNEISSHDVHDDLDVEIENLYRDQNLQDFIMDEVIDDQRNFLMEVPDLPEPNVYARKEILFPTKFPGFLTSPDSNGEGPPHKFLKKVKGRQSLNLALSWVAFTVDKKLPTITEAVGVTDIFDKPGLRNDSRISMSESMKVDLAKAEKILTSVVHFSDSPPKSGAERLRFLDSENSDYRPPDAGDAFKMLLNRNERRRVAKLEGRVNDMRTSDSDDSVVEDVEGPDGPDDTILRPAKRPRIDNDTDNNADEEDDSRVLSCTQGMSLPLTASADMAQDLDAYYDVAGPCYESSAFQHCEDEENKENWPPFSLSFPRSIDASSDPHRYHESPTKTEYLPEPEIDNPDEGSFRPLSFESRAPVSRLPSQALNCPTQSSEKQQDASMDILFDVPDFLVSKTLGSLSSLELPTESEMTFHFQGIQTFAQLRAKTISSKEIQLSVSQPNISADDQDDTPREAPADIYDTSTIHLPESITMPQSIHKYMASLDILQRQGLVRSLKSQECLVDLAAREYLDGVDIILDPHSAIIFLSLFTLASQCDEYVERVAKLSWKFRRMLVIFEAYSESYARKGRKTLDSRWYGYTPPILKAIRKFRRDLNIAAACGTKSEETEVFYVFANSVYEGAIFTRLYGDFVEERDETGGAIWGDREWLDGDFLENEEANLATADGMNRFSASIILCQVSLSDFLDIKPEERIARFGEYIGVDSVEKFNIDLEGRYKAMEMMCASE